MLSVILTVTSKVQRQKAAQEKGAAFIINVP